MKRFTNEQKTQSVREYYLSGISAAAFARQNGINAKTFNHWKCTLVKSEQNTRNKQTIAKQSCNTNQPQLLPLQIENLNSFTQQSAITHIAKLKRNDPNSVMMQKRLVKIDNFYQPFLHQCPV